MRPSLQCVSLIISGYRRSFFEKVYDRGGSSEVRTLPLAKFLLWTLIERLEVALYIIAISCSVLINLNSLYTMIFVRMHQTSYPFAYNS